VTVYRERLWAPPALYLATALVIPASLLVFLPISVTTGVLVAIGMEIGVLVLLWALAPVVEVTETEFRAGRARLPRSVVGEVAGFTGAAATTQRGPALDARAWTLFRGYVHGVVRVEVRDDADPTPYWLVSVRDPQAVTKALTS
jgi:subtilisin family serine protease